MNTGRALAAVAEIRGNRRKARGNKKAAFALTVHSACSSTRWQPMPP